MDQRYLVWLDSLNNACSIPKPIRGYQDVADEFAKHRHVADGRTSIAVGTAEELRASYKIKSKKWEKRNGTGKNKTG